MALGSNHMTTTTMGPFSPAAIYAETYFAGAVKNKPALKFFTDYTEEWIKNGRGQSLVIPKPQPFTTATKVVGTPIVPQNPTTTSATISVNQDKYNSFVIEKSVALQSRLDSATKANIEKAIDALMNTIDAYILGLASGFATTVAATSNTGDNLYANFVTARKTLTSASIPMESRGWFLGADMESRCLGMTQFTSALYRGSQPVQTGDTGGAQFLGAEVFIAPNVASATVTTTTDTNFLAHKEGIGYIMALNEFEVNYSPDHLGYIYTAHAVYGAVVADTAWGVKLTSTY